jgi:glyoxylase I family protein
MCISCSLCFAGIPYTLSRSGRPAIFTRDPDANALEFTQVE